ncbi:MAG: sulfite exporter TauE/SafE family protein [Thermomicrobiales bacterium]|nr:sulfite exporter TauE/SafE family protein [Thermomicrobiales bacterium]
MATIAAAIFFGVLIGLLLGMVGGGGSILTVPILVYVIGLGVHEATATSLIIVGATALFGAVPHAMEGRVRVPTALLFGGSGIAGAFAGTWLNQRVDGQMILLLFGILMVVVAARMAFGHRPKVDPAEPRKTWIVPLAGLAVGVMTGFFGVGGGFLIVPALVLAVGLPMRMAVGTSLVVIAINSGAGIVAHLGTGGFDVAVAGLFLIGGAVGGNLGGRLAGRVNEAKLSRGFAALVAAVGVFLILRNGAGFA